MPLFVLDKWAIGYFPPCEVGFSVKFNLTQHVDDFTASEPAFPGGGSPKSEPHVTRCWCPWLWKPNARRKWKLSLFVCVCKHYKWWVLRCLEGVSRAWTWNLCNSSGSTLSKAGSGGKGEGERETREASAAGVLVAYSLAVPPSSSMCPSWKLEVEVAETCFSEVKYRFFISGWFFPLSWKC